MLDFDLFTRVVDEAGPSLGRIDFFNYGEAFLHKRAVEMCEYIKSRFPHIYLYTSTNGLAFTEERCDGWCTPGIDEVTFSIDGATAGELRDSTGSAATSTRRSATCARRPTRSSAPAATCRSSTGATSSSPTTTATRRWRSRGPMAAEIGVDRLCWELTDHPEDMFSRRFVRRERRSSRRSTRDLGRQQSRQRDPGRDAARRDRRAGPACPDCRSSRRPGRPVTADHDGPQPLDAARSRPRRATAAGWSGSARSCAAATAQVVNRDFERAWLPQTLPPGATVEVPMTITAPDKPGRYGLKFDLVSEGIDWFEACGSPTTMRTLVVIRRRTVGTVRTWREAFRDRLHKRTPGRKTRRSHL